MHYTFPHLIESCVGEKIVFEKIEPTANGGRLVGEAFCQPGSGPVMHTHWQQDEGLQVLSGKMGYQVAGGQAKYVLPGESVVFERGTPHRFWAEGREPLHCAAWIEPVNTIVFFLTSVFAAQNKAGDSRPETFDSAYLLTRYAAEYDLHDIPPFVKKVVMPATYRLGQLLGKYKHFKDAPAPLKKA